MKQSRLFRIAVVLLMGVCFVACEGPVGPMGERGERGPAGEDGRNGRDGKDGADLWIQVVEGTILNRNYRPRNEDFAAIPVGSQWRGEPTILFFGIENDNGVYTKIDFSSIIWGGSNEDYAVPGTEGWYILVYDRWKEIVGSNYQVKFVQ